MFCCSGWHLGEQAEWAKYTNFEAGTRIPFIVHVPGKTKAIRTAALCEANDIYPTVVALAGLPIPELCAEGSQEMYCVEGVSLAPLWIDPQRPWKSAAFSQFPRPDRGFPQPAPGLPPFESNGTHKTEAVMGYTVRTHEWRFTQWLSFDPLRGTANWNKSYGRELYDHRNSPVPHPSFDYENYNVVADPANIEIVANLSSILKGGWRLALPPTNT